MWRTTGEDQPLSRRALLKGLGLAPLLLRAAPLHASWLTAGLGVHLDQHDGFALADIRLQPHYPARSPLEDVLRRVPPGSDDYVTEQYAFEIVTLLRAWAGALKTAPADLSSCAAWLASSITGSSLGGAQQIPVRSGSGVDVVKYRYEGTRVTAREHFVGELQAWLRSLPVIETAEFEITSLEVVADSPLAVRLAIRYDIVGRPGEDGREQRIGTWQTEWRCGAPGQWMATRWEAGEETRSRSREPIFVDVTERAFGAIDSYKAQLVHGSDYWRTVLDGACGIDVYGNNGLAAGDFDNDGLDDVYICQPAGLPNRLYRNRGDGTFEDVTERAGVGVLDNTACALFGDFGNRGLQDLLVVCGTGPLLFVNRGDGTFAHKQDAFRFASPPQGTFTHAALADYDRDGGLDIYLCVYSYYLGLDQYHYPVPYFDARNGPPNYLLHNDGDWTFSDRTQAAGLNVENNRYSFACAWGEAATTGSPDLYVVNDFGRNNLYRNNGDGTFTAASTEAHVEDVGAGMSACWTDYDNDGRQDLYVANMWSSAGQRVAAQKQFHQNSPQAVRALYQRHARGNALYRNQGSGRFDDVGEQAGVAMGRWAWASDLWDFDHDGYPDLYVANGYISAPGRGKHDLASFFWRQVVAKSPDDATPTLAYEHGWQALNELIRSDTSWSGFERNVMYANNRDGTFSEVSAPAGLDFPEDSRSFILADLDHDGRLELILKNRNAPQVRVLKNVMRDIGDSVSFRLRGTRSNRDAIGAGVTLEAGGLRQTRYLEAGSGFLAQHAKEIFFGVGKVNAPLRATILWPSGLTQIFEALPRNHRIEIEEGTASYAAKPFAAQPPGYRQAGPEPGTERLPLQVETWLVEPLKAPGFRLPDLTGRARDLDGLREEFRGASILLLFWSAGATQCEQQLKRFEQSRSSLSASQVRVVAINVDPPQAQTQAQSSAVTAALSFPVLFATDEVAGTYNIIYRYLFDRRRDLPLPCSFLLDKSGMIVKVYQGELNPETLLTDAHSIPSTPAERARKALPFPGTLYQSSLRRNDFTYGVAMFQHGYLAQAEDSFAQVIALKPQDPEAHYNLGTLSLRKGDFPAARRYLEQALALRSDYPEAWNNLGMIAAQQGDAAEAVRDFQQALSLRPAYPTALLNLGNVYRRQGAAADAERCLSRALEAQPDDPEANYSLGMFYAQQNQLDRASDYLEKAVALRPDYAEARNNLGVLFVREQDYSKAEAQFKDSIRLVPTFDQAYLNLARLYELRKDPGQARSVLETLLAAQPRNAAATQALEMLNSKP